MTAPFPTALVAAACFERDRRAESAPRAVAAQRVSAEAATLDYQAWAAIADWLEHGTSKIIGCWGGVADPPETAIDWDLMAQATGEAVTRLTAKVDAETAFANGAAADPDQRERKALAAADLAALAHRRDLIICIDQAVSRQAQTMGDLTAQLRALAAANSAAAAA